MTLVERLEKATGASRELDAEIAAFVAGAECEIQPNGEPAYHRGGSWVSIGPVLPFTGSVDAALSLVPDKWKHSTSGERGAWGTCVLFPPDYDPRTKEGAGEVQMSSAKSDALALCAAALRARQHGEG